MGMIIKSTSKINKYYGTIKCDTTDRSIILYLPPPDRPHRRILKIIKTSNDDHLIQIIGVECTINSFDALIFGGPGHFQIIRLRAGKRNWHQI